MPPRKSTTPKPHGPPRTPPELRAIKVGVSFRADQRAALTRLQSDRRLSLLCQKAVDQDAELESLPDGLRDDALEAAAARFFDEWGLEWNLAGSYMICQNELVPRGVASEEMGLDAEALGIPAGKLIPALQELFGLEKEHALRKAAVLGKYRSGKNDLDCCR
jgi:hypothetical protein